MRASVIISEKCARAIRKNVPKTTGFREQLWSTGTGCRKVRSKHESMRLHCLLRHCPWQLRHHLLLPSRHATIRWSIPVTFATLNRLQRNSRQQHAQFRRIDGHHRTLVRRCHHLEGSGFEALVRQSKTSVFPIQYLLHLLGKNPILLI